MAKSEIGSAVGNPNEELVCLDLKEIKRRCWPGGRRIALRMSLLERFHLCKQLDQLELKYPDDINEMVSGPQSIGIETGKPFDIMSLLSFNGEVSYLHRNTVGHYGLVEEKAFEGIPNKRYREDQVVLKLEEKAFEGKYIMVCCFHAPFFYLDGEASVAQGLASLCLEMYHNRPDFEMILVVKTKMNINSREFFDHFLSGFPYMCLVVPFEQSKCRDFICKSLGLECSSVQCLIVDKEEDVLAHRRILLCQYPHFVDYYGADYFPFNTCLDYQEWESFSASYLLKLLGCEPTGDIVNLKMATGGKRRVSLSQTVVWFYICVNACSINIVAQLYRECKKRGLEFEVVVVCVPFMFAVDPVAIQEEVDRMLRYKNLSWGCCRFNNSNSRNLWRLLNREGKDGLVIMDSRSDNVVVDRYGMEVAYEFPEPYGGGIQAYPFTRKALVESKLKRTQELTLEKMLFGGQWNYVLRGNSKIYVQELKGKDIIVFFGCIDDKELLCKLAVWYEQIKERPYDFEVVVFIYTNCLSGGGEFDVSAADDIIQHFPSDMPWLACPYDIDRSRDLMWDIGLLDERSTLVEFDKDGQICSFRAQDLLTDHGPDAFPFSDVNLRQEVIAHLRNINPDMMDRFER